MLSHQIYNISRQGHTFVRSVCFKEAPQKRASKRTIAVRSIMPQAIERWVCPTCAVQYADPVSETPPRQCKICEDERQYIKEEGQTWTTLTDISKTHKNVITEEESGLIGIGIDPPIGIGNRALLVKTDKGNIMWDCISLFDNNAKKAIKDAGGVQAIAISHPHFLGACVEAAEYFDAPIYMSGKDKEWICRNSSRYFPFEGTQIPLPGDAMMINLGGHFRGSSVLHWTGKDGRGVLLTGDTIQYTPCKGWVSFMYSYPNYIPLPASQVERIQQAIKPLKFDRMYAGWFGKHIKQDAHAAVQRSADRYIGILRETDKSRSYF